MTLVLNKDIFSHIDRCDFLNNNFEFYVFRKKCCSVNFLFSKASSNVSSFKCNHLSGLTINNSFPLLSQRASEKGSFLRGYVNFNLSKIGGSVQEEKWLTHANSLDLLYLYLRWGRATGSCIRRRAAANQLTPPRNQVEPTTPSLSILINRRNSPRKRSLMYIFPPTAGRLWAMADPH